MMCLERGEADLQLRTMGSPTTVRCPFWWCRGESGAVIPAVGQEATGVSTSALLAPATVGDQSSHGGRRPRTARALGTVPECAPRGSPGPPGGGNPGGGARSRGGATERAGGGVPGDAPVSAERSQRRHGGLHGRVLRGRRRTSPRGRPGAAGVCRRPGRKAGGRADCRRGAVALQGCPTLFRQARFRSRRGAPGHHATGSAASLAGSDGQRGSLENLLSRRRSLRARSRVV